MGKVVKYTMCQKHNSRGLGLSRFGVGLGEECYTFYGDWLTGNSPSWKQRFRTRILNMFWEGSHSWNWFGRQMASRNANQTYIARWRSLIVSVHFSATWQWLETCSLGQRPSLSREEGERDFFLCQKKYDNCFYSWLFTKMARERFLKVSSVHILFLSFFRCNS